jgi:DNA modification methylase
MTIRILNGDCRDVLRTLPDKSVQCCVTSPPYFGLRDYGVAGQIGLEATPDDFVSAMIQVFGSVRRVLRDDGTLWLNLGDSYAATSGPKTISPQTAYSTGRAGGNARGAPNKTLAYKAKSAGFKDYQSLKPKDLIGIPWRVAFALQADGWYLRSDIIWHKPNPMPESVTDRPTSAHEHIFLFAKSERYFYDADAVKEAAEMTPQRRLTPTNFGRKNVDGRKDNNGTLETIADPGRQYDTRNLRNVWTVATQPYSGAHFATFPPALIEPCIKAGSRPGDTVLDPFGGAGTTGLVADRLGRDAVLIELNPSYVNLIEDRIRGDAGMFAALETSA